MKLCIVFLATATYVLCAPQRSPYAPSPVVYPQVLPQYTSPANEVDNRFGNDNISTTPYVGLQTEPGSLYAVQDLEWIYSEWPRDKIPFNVVNREHLLNHRGQPQPCVGNQCASSAAVAQPGTVQSRGSFLG